jgi:hypothetical protein
MRPRPAAIRYRAAVNQLPDWGGSRVGCLRADTQIRAYEKIVV